MSQRILLAHLDPEVESELRNTLSMLAPSGQLDRAQETVDSLIDWRSYDVVFCPPERTEIMSILAASAGAPPRPAVIAASRIPEVSEWMDVLEAGAKDYVAAPFEGKQIGLMLAACD